MVITITESLVWIILETNAYNAYTIPFLPNRKFDSRLQKNELENHWILIKIFGQCIIIINTIIYDEWCYVQLGIILHTIIVL